MCLGRAFVLTWLSHRSWLSYSLIHWHVFVRTGPPKIRTSSGRKEVTGPSVSLGTASDVVVRLECGGAVDGITLEVNQQELPKWNRAAIGSTPGIRLLQDDTVEITPVYLANTITLECMFVLSNPEVPPESTQVQIVKSKCSRSIRAVDTKRSRVMCAIHEVAACCSSGYFP